jgi:hypothetical protein
MKLPQIFDKVRNILSETTSFLKMLFLPDIPDILDDFNGINFVGVYRFSRLGGKFQVIYKDKIYQYDLLKNWDLATARYSGQKWE